MYKNINQRGAILPILVVILLLIGILVSTKLISIPKIFNSKAGGGPITFRRVDGKPLPTLPKEGNLDATNSLDVQIELNPPGLSSSPDPYRSNPNVYILEVDEKVDDAKYGIIFHEITKAFYQKYPDKDKYDSISIFPAFKPKLDMGSTFSGVHTTIQSNVRGICQPISLPDKQYWGSDKLASGEIYPYLETYNNWNEIANKNGALLLEETSHQWLTWIGKKHHSFPPGNPPDGMNRSCLDTQIPLLDESDLHWSKGLQSLPESFGAMREARPWVDNGNGSYSFDDSLYSAPRRFHPFDLYLMGLIDKSEVKGEFLLLSEMDNPDLHPFMPGPGQTTSGPADNIITTKAKAQKITINDIIAIAGEERKPSSQDSQKDFNLAFIIFTKKGQAPNDTMVREINKAANDFPGQWAYATNNKSTINKKNTDPNPLTVHAVGYYLSDNPVTGSSPAVNVDSFFPLTLNYHITNPICDYKTGDCSKTVFVRFYYSDGTSLDRKKSIIYRPIVKPSPIPTPTPATPAASPGVGNNGPGGTRGGQCDSAGGTCLDSNQDYKSDSYCTAPSFWRYQTGVTGCASQYYCYKCLSPETTAPPPAGTDCPAGHCADSAGNGPNGLKCTGWIQDSSKDKNSFKNCKDTGVYAYCYSSCS